MKLTALLFGIGFTFIAHAQLTTSTPDSQCFAIPAGVKEDIFLPSNCPTPVCSGCIATYQVICNGSVARTYEQRFCCNVRTLQQCNQ